MFKEGGVTISQTKPEIRRAWDKQNMTHYGVSLHNEHDKELIAYVENLKNRGESASNIIRNALSIATKMDK